MLRNIDWKWWIDAASRKLCYKRKVRCSYWNFWMHENSIDNYNRICYVGYSFYVNYSISFWYIFFGLTDRLKMPTLITECVSIKMDLWRPSLRQVGFGWLLAFLGHKRIKNGVLVPSNLLCEFDEFKNWLCRGWDRILQQQSENVAV